MFAEIRRRDREKLDKAHRLVQIGPWFVARRRRLRVGTPIPESRPMPNTLVHIGIHLPLTRGILRRSDPKWILLGCAIPDLPWILQRVVRAALPGVDPLDLRLYATAQASLFFCLILSAAAAFLSRHPVRTFAVLASGSALHLFLDALEIKWGNGVHFFAPLSWRMIQFGFFRPESPVVSGFTLLGLGMLGTLGFRKWPTPSDRRKSKPGPTSGRIAGALLAGYFLLPLPLLSGPERADNHFVGTLRNPDERTGKPIALDRTRWRPGEGFRIFAGEVLVAEGMDGVPAGTVSVRGRFVAPDRIWVLDLRRHPSGLREAASYVGLAGIAAVWIAAAFVRFRNEKGPNAG
jgi:hypothetical protein